MEDDDIYENLPDIDLGEEIEKLREQNNLLQKHVQSLECDIEKLCTRITEMKETQNNLTRNISELFKTAKSEIERKDRTINELRTQLEQQFVPRKLPKKREREYSPSWGQQNAKKVDIESRLKDHNHTVENKGHKEIGSGEWQKSSHRSRSGDRIHSKDRKNVYKQDFDRKRSSFRYEKNPEPKHRLHKSESRVEATCSHPEKGHKEVKDEEKKTTKTPAIKNYKTKEEKDVNRNKVEITEKEKNGHREKKKDPCLEHGLGGRKEENGDKIENIEIKKKSDHQNLSSSFKESIIKDSSEIIKITSETSLEQENIKSKNDVLEKNKQSIKMDHLSDHRAHSSNEESRKQKSELKQKKKKPKKVVKLDKLEEFLNWHELVESKVDKNNVESMDMSHEQAKHPQSPEDKKKLCVSKIKPVEKQAHLYKETKEELRTLAEDLFGQDLDESVVGSPVSNVEMEDDFPKSTRDKDTNDVFKEIHKDLNNKEKNKELKETETSVSERTSEETKEKNEDKKERQDRIFSGHENDTKAPLEEDARPGDVFKDIPKHTSKKENNDELKKTEKNLKEKSNQEEEINIKTILQQKIVQCKKKKQENYDQYRKLDNFCSQYEGKHKNFVKTIEKRKEDKKIKNVKDRRKSQLVTKINKSNMENIKRHSIETMEVQEKSDKEDLKIEVELNQNVAKEKEDMQSSNKTETDVFDKLHVVQTHTNIPEINRDAKQINEENKGSDNTNTAKDIINTEISNLDEKCDGLIKVIENDAEQTEKNVDIEKQNNVEIGNKNMKAKTKNKQKNSKAQKENLEEVAFKLFQRVQETHLVQNTLKIDSSSIEKENVEQKVKESIVSIKDVQENTNEPQEPNKMETESKTTEEIKVDEENKALEETDKTIFPKLSETVDVCIQTESRGVEQHHNSNDITNERDPKKKQNKSPEIERKYKKKTIREVISSRVLRSAVKRNSISDDGRHPVKRDDDTTPLKSHSSCNEEVLVFHINENETYNNASIDLLKEDLHLSFEASNENISFPENNTNSNNVNSSLNDSTVNFNSSLNDSIIYSFPPRKRRKVTITWDD